MAPPPAPRTSSSGIASAAAQGPVQPPKQRGQGAKQRVQRPKEKKARSRSTTAARRPARRRSRALPLGIAVLALCNLSGGVYAALTTDTTERGSDALRDADPPRGPAPGGPVANVADGSQVAPLRRVVPPDVLAVGAGPIAASKIAKLSGLGRVTDVISVAGGAVQLQGRQVNAFAVDPSSFRSWTPPGTAKKTDLWAALAADRFVVSPSAADQLQLSAGFHYPVVARTVPTMMMGGSGSLGLPGIDMLVSRKSGARMGLVPNVAVLVNAPGVSPAKLAKEVATVLGKGTNVVNLHEKKYRAPSDGGRPGSYLDLYKQAATSCQGLSWTVLAAIGQVESDHGRNAGRSSAGALGPMQFLPSTWKAYGVDGDGDGKADIMNPYDAIPGAAKYLCANGAGKGGKRLYRAVWQYNHADWYVRKVLNLAKAYAVRFS